MKMTERVNEAIRRIGAMCVGEFEQSLYACGIYSSVRLGELENHVCKKCVNLTSNPYQWFAVSNYGINYITLPRN